MLFRSLVDQILGGLRIMGQAIEIKTLEQFARRRDVVDLGFVAHLMAMAETTDLVRNETAAMGQNERSPGIGIKIDLQTGLIMDLLNDQGVLGYLPWRTLAPQQDIPFRLEMELFGRVCVPRLIIGDEIILHPSLYLVTRGSLSALTGNSLPHGEAKFFNLEVTSSVEEPEICVAM